MGINITPRCKKKKCNIKFLISMNSKKYRNVCCLIQVQLFQVLGEVRDVMLTATLRNEMLSFPVFPLALMKDLM